MTNSSPVLRVGTRSSKLAVIQTKLVTAFLRERFNQFKFVISEFSSPGDRNQVMDLRVSPPDFFTKDLDNALFDNQIDIAVHSAKDLPQEIPEGIDWCWLPLREDPRDVLVLPKGKDRKSIPVSPRIGISSDRREFWCKSRYPEAQLLPIRGTIERRLEQLDNGDYDIVVMAAAALIRLGLTNRISEYIESCDLSVPDGQGILAITFRQNDPYLTQMRKLFVKSTIFAGAGCGHAGTCTLETRDALQNADVCIYDALLDKEILHNLPSRALKIDAGKRSGEHRLEQHEINSMLAFFARRGLSVVRLKGGDPGIFGRLAEEIDTLDSLSLPYSVLPGISSLQCATTGTGMLLTRRGVSRGFCVMTPRNEGGAVSDITGKSRNQLPQVYFMALSSVSAVCKQLFEDGESPSLPAAVILGAGTISEQIIRGTLDSLPALIEPIDTNLPGLVIVGEVSRYSYRYNGALAGLKVLVTSSDALCTTVCKSVLRYNGIPVIYNAITISPCPENITGTSLTKFDWLILTSPSAVHALISVMRQSKIDIRTLPKIAVAGEGTSNALKEYYINADLIPESNFGADGLVEKISNVFKKGQNVLRLRSDVAGESLSDRIRKLDVLVTDIVICRNKPVHSGPVPSFDAVFFASSSAVSSLLDRSDPLDLSSKIIVAIGTPTAEALRKRGICNVITGKEAMADSAIEALAMSVVNNSLCSLVESSS